MDSTVVARLEALVTLQRIDSRLDRIRSVRGGLPEEVRDLEDELEGLRTRLERFADEMEGFQTEISQRNNAIEEFKILIKKYNAQLMEVKNNREYEAVNKEIELANLEILTSERKIKQFTEQIVDREAKKEVVELKFNERNNDLEEKNRELEQIILETQREEEALLAESAEAQKNIEARLLRAYLRIRHNMRNGLAVVTMDRGACGGCFSIIPPQRQAEVRQKKRIIVCENCGRILADETFFQPETAEVAETTLTL